MAKLFFVSLFCMLSAHAQIFSLPFSGEGQAPVDKSIAALGKLDVDSAGFEDTYRQLSMEIERQLDIQRSDCQEKPGDAGSRQRCFRDVVTRHKKYIENSYEAKKSLLQVLHKRQLVQLEQSKDQALKEFEKQF